MSNPIVSLQSAASLFGLSVLIFWFYRGYIIDKFRQDMFALRDDLFDVAARGQIEFGNPHYWALRTTMNGAIRTAHRINLLFWIWLVVDAARHPKDWNDLPMAKAQQVPQALTSTQQQIVDGFRQQMHYLMIRHVVHSSPILMVTLILPVGLFLMGREKAAAGVKQFGSAFERLDSVALVAGAPRPA